MSSTFLDELNNSFARVHDLATEAEEWSSRPAWIEFSTNNLCNLACVMCSQSEHPPLQVLPKDEAAAILDQVLPKASLLTPSSVSEPMLSNIKLMVQKCREHEVFLNFHSNATVLNGARLREIADRVHHVFISFDSPVPEVFEEVRAGASFDRVVQNIREILAVAGELDIPVDFVAVLMSRNAPQLADLVDFLADLGAAEHRSELRVQPVIGLPPDKRHMDPMVVMTADEICGHLDRACERAAARQMRFRVEIDEPFRRQVDPALPRVRWVMGHLVNCQAGHIREKYPQFCSMATYHLKIDPEGQVFPCCRAPSELSMGNVREQSVEEIWNGERYRAFRRRMFRGDYPKACRSCDVLIANPHFKAAAVQESGTG